MMGITRASAGRGTIWKTVAALTAFAALAVVSVAFGARPAHASTFTVNSVGDAGDNAASDGVCATNNFILIGSQFVVECTLRAAIQQANATAIEDDIAFAIPGASGAVHTITPSSELPDVTSPVDIDGYTQPGASPNTLANGTNAKPKIELSGAGFALAARNGLDITTSSATVRGLVINRWDTAVRIRAGSQNNKVEGNFLGTDASGAQDLGNGNGVVMEGLGHTVGGTTPAARNVVSGNSSGVAMYGSGNKVQGNLIGADATGAQDLGNNTGVSVFGQNNVVGGTSAAARNLISGNDYGIEVTGSSASGNRIEGNYIGTDASGNADLGNSSDGVLLDNAPNNTVGGATAAARNVIAGNFIGVEVFRANATGNRILRNSIFGNDSLGINLNAGVADPPSRVTANDLRDPDTGANDLQNYPVLSSAIKSGPTTTIKGTLNSTPNRNFTIQFFSNPQANPSGFGEGRFLIGGTTVETNASGNASFVFRPARAVPAGQKVSATATDDPLGNTSEFSRAVQVAPDRTRPTITRPAPRPGAAIRQPNVRIQATVKDGQMELAKSHIRLFVDGKRKTGFTYNRTTDRLSFAARNLSSGRHSVRIKATDGAGNAANRSWGFKVVRR